MRRRPIPTRGCIGKSNGAESRLAYLGHLLIENRHGLIADAMATIADGFAEREAATLMLHAQWQRAPWPPRTVGADKAYDTRDFVDLMRELGRDAARHAEPRATRAAARSTAAPRATTATR